MEEIPLLREIAIVAAAAVLVAVVVARIRVPTVAGLLLSGALVGPHGLRLVSDTHAIELIAEVGVVLLLFTIGLEFSLDRLTHIFRRVALGGILQVGGTLALVAAGAVALGVGYGPAVFYGFVFAMSSTAIVLRALTERRELDAPHGRFIVAALIFQDLCVIPMVLLVPLLGTGEQGGTYADIGIALGKAAAVVVGVLGISRLVVPRVLEWVEASRSREVFLLAVLTLCVGTAWLTSLAGLSLALGAFLGGLVVAGTEYSHRAMGDILPLRDVFVSFFFVSLGMFFNVQVLAENPMLVLLLLVVFVLGKGAVATVAALLMRFPPRAAWLAGVGLAQFGEFGFVLMRLGMGTGLVERAAVEPVLIAGIISMFLTPLLLQRAPHITAGERLLAPLARLLRARSIEELDSRGETLRDHVVVIGYGVAGRFVASTLRNRGIKHVILELNADNVRRGRAAGDPVFYADATSKEALRHAHIEHARCIVVMINDPQATFRVVDAVRRVAPQAAVVIRTRYLADQDRLLALGGSRVVAEEVEGGIEVLAHVLRELDVPRNVIEAEIHGAREATQASARSMTIPRNRWAGGAPLSALKVESVLVVEGSPGASRSLREIDLRAKTGALLVAIQRGESLLSHPRADEALAPGDVAYLIGEADSVQAAVGLLGARAEISAS
jgi:CPA2 family monovalent cation:H+ antiporter-2